MGRLPKLLLACLAVVLLLPAAAYADQTDEAHRLLDQANGLVEQINALDSEAQELLAAVGQIGDAASKDAADALPLLKKAAALNDEIITDFESIVALYDEAGALDISPEFKAFLGLRKEVTQLKLKLYTLTGEMTARAETAYREWDRLSDSERSALRTNLVDLATQAQARMAEIDEKQAASEKYYTDKRIDEELAGSGSWTTSVIKNVAFLAVIGFGSYLLGQWYRRRRLRRAVPALDRGDEDGQGAEPGNHRSEPPGPA
jgi:hypothetical protein